MRSNLLIYNISGKNLFHSIINAAINENTMKAKTGGVDANLLIFNENLQLIAIQKLARKRIMGSTAKYRLMVETMCKLLVND